MIKLKREVKVGLFALITLGALYWGINFLKGHDLFSKDNTYYATYDQVNGIQKSSAIVIKGFKVGVISDITYDPQRSDKIVLQFSIKNKFRIPTNSTARIYSDGLLGGKAVEIALGDSKTYLSDGDTLPSFREKDIFDIAGSELEYIKQRLNIMASDISKTLDTFNTLLSDNSENITSTLANLSEISGNLSRMIQTEETNIRNIVNNMNTFSASLRDNTDKIGNIVTNVENFTDSLQTANIPALVNDLSSTVDQVNGILAKVNDKEGTMGKLFSDDALYDSLVAASSNLSLLLQDVKEHPKRYVHFSIFGRKDK